MHNNHADAISYDNKTYSIQMIKIVGMTSDISSPLEPYLIEKDFMKYFSPEYMTKMVDENHRPYRCEWEIDNERKLVLREFKSLSSELRTTNQLLGDVPIGKIKPFPGRGIETMRHEIMLRYMFAEWLSGSIKAHSEETSNTIHIKVVQGIVIDIVFDS